MTILDLQKTALEIISGIGISNKILPTKLFASHHCCWTVKLLVDLLHKSSKISNPPVPQSQCVTIPSGFFWFFKHHNASQHFFIGSYLRLLIDLIVSTEKIQLDMLASNPYLVASKLQADRDNVLGWDVSWSEPTPDFSGFNGLQECPLCCCLPFNATSKDMKSDKIS